MTSTAARFIRLALIITRNRGAAEEAVAGAFSGVRQVPGKVDLREQSLRGALAGAVYSRCGEARGSRRSRRSRRRATGLGALATLPRKQRSLLALVLLGEHTRHHAAERVGVSDDVAGRLLTVALRTVGAPDPMKRRGFSALAPTALRASWLGGIQRRGRRLDDGRPVRNSSS